MNKSCSNKNEVFTFFNAIQDGRAFTDYRSNNETYQELGDTTNKLCNTNENSYDTRICMQRNAQYIIDNVHTDLLSTLNLPRCKSTNNKINNSNINSNLVSNSHNNHNNRQNNVNKVINNIKNMDIVNNQNVNLSNVVNNNNVN